MKVAIVHPWRGGLRGGEMLAELRALAGLTVSILGPLPFAALRHHHARCLGLIFPGGDDLGIVPVEAVASGRPVIAFGRGGATETVVEGVTRTFVHEQTVEARVKAVERCDVLAFDPAAAVGRAAAFGEDRIQAEMSAFIDARSLRLQGRSVPRSVAGKGITAQRLPARTPVLQGASKPTLSDTRCNGRRCRCSVLRKPSGSDPVLADLSPGCHILR